MSLLSWLNWYKAPTQPLLPDPNKEGSHEAANEEIKYHLVSSGRKRRRNQYCRYDDEQRAKVACYANDHGLSAAAVISKFPSVFDSHLHFVSTHGCHGGLIEVPGPKCDCDNAAVYLGNFSDSCLQSPLGKQADFRMFDVDCL